MRKNLIIRIISTIVFAALLFYVMIPTINLQDINFWFYLLAIFIFYKIMGVIDIKDIIIGRKKLDLKGYKSYIVVFIIFVIILLINLVISPLFDAKGYSKRITIDETTNFTDDIKEVNFKALPLLDKDSSQKLGDRVMGQMPELVSQFQVSDLYTQINYKSDIVRVTPLEYASVIKYFTNRNKGVKGFITVNSVTGEATLTKLDKGMRYMPSALFNERLERKLRFLYPTEVFDEINFEIDNEGKPYWIVPTVKYKGISLRKEINGVIIFDPVTGKGKKYNVDKVPSWVDHVYSADLILEQVNDWGTYKKGFFNSIIGQKGVVLTTDGYNYTVMNDDVYLYTGITSVAKDESNIGFILCNMRTKDTHFYAVPGAEEYSAMASAEGQVQQMKYVSSFPLLINLNNRPTYLMSLKDNAGLVKMYAFVDVSDYQKVVVTDSSLGIEKASSNYLNNVEYDDKTNNLESKTIKIKEITNAIINGNTNYYIIDNDNQKYRVSINIASDKLPFLKPNDEIKISYNRITDVTEIKSIE